MWQSKRVQILSENLIDYIQTKTVSESAIWQVKEYHWFSRFIHRKSTLISLIVLFIIICFVSLTPFFIPFSYTEHDWENIRIAPHIATMHFMGTDAVGRDLMARIAIGGRVSLCIGILGAVITAVIGTAYGTIAGYVGGKIDRLMMSIVDILTVLPFIFVVILLVTFLGQNSFLVFLVISLFAWLDLARLVRSQTLVLKKADFITLAKMSGLSNRQVIIHHILPNILGFVLVYTTLEIPSLILLESLISFLGLGIQEPMSSWGTLLSDGVTQMEIAPWLVLFPILFLSITLLCFNFIGDSLRDALDPKF